MMATTASPGLPALRELVDEAIRNLLALPQRSALALLGIVIGTAAVVAMLSIGHMAGREALKPFEAMGIDMLSVQASSPGGEVQPLEREKIERLTTAVPEVVAATAFAIGQSGVPRPGEGPPPTVVAASPDLLKLAGLRLAEGRFLAPVDAEGLVAVIGAEVASPPAPHSRRVAVGDTVRGGDYIFYVIGVLAPARANALSPTPFDQAIIVPFASAKRALGVATPTGALVRMVQGADEQAVSARVSAALSPPGGPPQVTVRGAREVIATVKAQRAVHTQLLAALAGVALLVGGIGVMNVMLMSLIERRREIGLRAAVGATPQDIQVMFLVEAAVLAAAGGIVGVLVGVVVAFIVAHVSGWAFEVALYALPLGAGVATAVGVGFGVYPAITASRLDPIEALRAE